MHVLAQQRSTVADKIELVLRGTNREPCTPWMVFNQFVNHCTSLVTHTPNQAKHFVMRVTQIILSFIHIQAYRRIVYSSVASSGSIRSEIKLCDFRACNKIATRSRFWLRLITSKFLTQVKSPGLLCSRALACATTDTW